MGRNRTRAKRATIKRMALAGQVTETDGSQTPDSTETTGEQQGVGGLLTDPHHVRSDLQLISQHLKRIGAKNAKKLAKRVVDLALNGENDRVQVAAIRAWIAQLKVALQIDLGERPSLPQIHRHGHVHVDLNDIRSDLAAIAAEAGITIDIEEAGEEPR